MSALPPPLQIDHRCRVSILEPEKLWSLRGDVLVCEVEGFPELRIPLASLHELRLAYGPTRFQRNRYICTLRDARGTCARIQNEHFRGALDFEDRTESYLALVRTLIGRTAMVAPACRFRSGTGFWNWLGQTGCLVSSMLFLLVIVILLWSAIGWLAVVKGVVILFLMPTAIRWVIKNKPAYFSPREIPADLLPRAPEKMQPITPHS